MPAFIIGIAGGSASGKSAIARELRERLAPLTVHIINQDRHFHEADRLPTHASRDGAHTWPDYNHPDSFDFPTLYRDLLRARDGSADLLILEGILVLHCPELRSLMDLKLFVDTEADERIVRRIRRNLASGHRLDDICDFYLDSVRYRHREFCEPTRVYADLVIPGGRDDRARAERALSDVCSRVRADLGSRAKAIPDEGPQT